MFTFDKLFILDLSDYEEIVENNIYLLFSTISYLIIIVSFISKSPRKTPDDGNPVPEHRSDSNLRNAEILYRLRIYRSYPVFFPVGYSDRAPSAGMGWQLPVPRSIPLSSRQTVCAPMWNICGWMHTRRSSAIF